MMSFMIARTPVRADIWVPTWVSAGVWDEVMEKGWVGNGRLWKWSALEMVGPGNDEPKDSQSGRGLPGGVAVEIHRDFFGRRRHAGDAATDGLTVELDFAGVARAHHAACGNREASALGDEEKVFAGFCGDGAIVG